MSPFSPKLKGFLEKPAVSLTEKPLKVIWHFSHEHFRIFSSCFTVACLTIMCHGEDLF